jgi:5-methylcytosine-specific restriction endonuclease McrA
MKCEYCGNEQNGSFATGRFCSIKCSCGFSSREKRKEINKKVSAKLKGVKPKHPHKITKEESAKGRQARIINEERKPSDKRSPETNRRVILREQDDRCNICKNEFIWMNNSLYHQLHHKDGNHHNNVRENLEVLCPNCHNQTDGFTGRGRHHTEEDKIKIKIGMKNSPKVLR